MKTLVKSKSKNPLARVLYVPVQSGLAVFMVLIAMVAGLAVLRFAPDEHGQSAFRLGALGSASKRNMPLPPPPQSSQVATERMGANLPPLSEFYVGVWVDSIDPALAAQLKLEKGIVVRYIVPGSPAEAAGLKPNDLLLTASDEPLTQPCGLGFAVDKAKGGKLALELLREGATLTVALTPTKRPAKIWTPPEVEMAQTADPAAPPGADTAAHIANRENLQKAIIKLEAELAKAREEVKFLKEKLAEKDGNPEQDAPKPDQN